MGQCKALIHLGSSVETNPSLAAKYTHVSLCITDTRTIDRNHRAKIGKMKQPRTSWKTSRGRHLRWLDYHMSQGQCFPPSARRTQIHLSNTTSRPPTPALQARRTAPNQPLSPFGSPKGQVCWNTREHFKGQENLCSHNLLHTCFEK